MIGKEPRKRLVAWSLSLVALIVVIATGALMTGTPANVSAQTIPPSAKDCLAEPRPDPLCLAVYVGMIKDLQTQAAAQGATIGSLQTQVASQGERIGRLEAQEAAQEARLRDLLAQVPAQGERIENLLVQVATLDARVTGQLTILDARLDGVMGLVNNLLSRVSALEARVGELSGA